MKAPSWSTFSCLAILVALAACSAEPDTEVAEGTVVSADGGEHAMAEGGGEHDGREGRGEDHARAEEGGEHGERSEGGEHDGEGEGEESGDYIRADDTWDRTRNGARLVLRFVPTANAFVGTVENTTSQTLCAVRVEVHLSTRTELGPTERTDLPAGESMNVELSTGGEEFDNWTAHPEVSPCSS